MDEAGDDVAERETRLREERLDVPQRPLRLPTSVHSTPAAKDSYVVRRMLEDPNVDAVLIATPDHMHAPISMAAMPTPPAAPRTSSVSPAASAARSESAWSEVA